MTIMVFMTADLNRGRGQYYENAENRGRYFGNIENGGQYYENVENTGRYLGNAENATLHPRYVGNPRTQFFYCDDVNDYSSLDNHEYDT